MKRKKILRHEFVDFVPENLEEGVLYVSIPYATASHRCCCGCGHEVVTPLTPTDWSMSFNGISVSLDPSIGNWSFPCKSHYWIEHGKINWATKWSSERVEQGRSWDQTRKESYYGKSDRPELLDQLTDPPSWLSRFFKRMNR